MIGAFGWRTAWVVSGVIVLLLAVPVCAVFMRKDPESMGILPHGFDPEPARTATGRRTAAAAVGEDWTVRQVFHSPTLWIILLATAMFSLAISGTVVHRIAFWEDTGLSARDVVIGTTLDPILVVASGLFFGIMAERVAARYIGLVGGVGVGLSMLPLIFARRSFVPAAGAQLHLGQLYGRQPDGEQHHLAGVLRTALPRHDPRRRLPGGGGDVGDERAVDRDAALGGVGPETRLGGADGDVLRLRATLPARETAAFAAPDDGVDSGAGGGGLRRRLSVTQRPGSCHACCASLSRCSAPALEIKRVC